MRALVVALIVAAASSAHAAPCPLEIPPGYTEVSTGEDPFARMRSEPHTTSADIKVYLSEDGNVQLTCMMLVFRDDHRPTRKSVFDMERGAVDGGKQSARKHLNDTRTFVGDQLVGESTDEIEDSLMRRRAIYAADAAGLVHMFTVICAGPEDQLTACQSAQQTMKLVVPNPRPFINAPQDPKATTAWAIGQWMGFLLLVVLIGLWIKSGARIWRRKPKPAAPP